MNHWSVFILFIHFKNLVNNFINYLDSSYVIHMPKVFAEYKEHAKKKIIEAALQVFSEKGYTKTTMKDIGKKLGISKGALYLYFPSKYELFKAIIEKWQETLNEIIVSSLKDKKIIDGLEGLFNRALSDHKNNFRLSFEFISESSHDAFIRDIIKENYDKNIETLSNYMEKMKLEEILGNEIDIHSQSMSIIALLIGLIGSLILGAEKKEVQNVWVKSIKLILGKH